MAARSILPLLSLAARSTHTFTTSVLAITAAKHPVFRQGSQRPLHTTTHLSTPATSPTSTASSGGNPFSSDTVKATMQSTTSIPGQTQTTQPPEEGARYAAFLGEADSNDGHETWRDAYAPPDPALDAANSAFLGEADSDDAFEAQKDIRGVKLESVDASQSSYLGEADSDDGFEADVEIYPEKHRHKIEDASVSGLHGQAGEGDQ